MEEEDTDSDDESELSNEDGLYTYNIDFTMERKFSLEYAKYESC